MSYYLAFGHQKNVGKDEAAKFAIQHLRFRGQFKDVQKGAFAEKMKAVCYEMFRWAGMKPGWYYDENKAAREIVLPLVGMTPRQIWIAVGMKMRDVFSDVWICNLLDGDKSDFLVISDLRFPNEAEAIKRRGGKVIKILRPSVPHVSDEADDPLLDYEGWSDVIINDGTLRDFHNSVVKIVDSMILTPGI